MTTQATTTSSIASPIEAADDEHQQWSECTWHTLLDVAAPSGMDSASILMPTLSSPPQVYTSSQQSSPARNPSLLAPPTSSYPSTNIVQPRAKSNHHSNVHKATPSPSYLNKPILHCVGTQKHYILPMSHNFKTKPKPSKIKIVRSFILNAMTMLYHIAIEVLTTTSRQMRRTLHCLTRRTMAHIVIANTTFISLALAFVMYRNSISIPDIAATISAILALGTLYVMAATAS